MQDCKLCERISAGTYCQGCLNDWLKIRVVVQNHLNEKYKTAVSEKFSENARSLLKMRDVKQYYILWNHNRQEFEKEISNW